jgi:DNA (cytosine-5)-methyltransferase 1
MTYRVLSLFAGIGGFDLGLERTGGFKTVAFCEIDPFCRRVLARHWPGVPCYDDVRELTRATLRGDGVRPNFICAGFPCQDASVAQGPWGKRTGIDGARTGLWRDVVRLAAEILPDGMLLENVPGLLSAGFGTVLGDLAELGFDAEWHCISASAVGAPHRRNRLWIVAYPRRPRWERPEQYRCLRVADRPQVPEHGHPFANAGRAMANDLAHLRVEHGLPIGVERQRVRALGNAVVPQIPELIGRAIMVADAGRLAA